jgi:hypothetical protein
MHMKIRLFILSLLIYDISFSQNVHQFLIGGELGYQYKDDNSTIESSNFFGSTENILQLNPTVGYFITKNIVTGIGLEYLLDNTKYKNYIYYSSLEKGFIIAPFIRFYAPFGLFLHAEFDYGTSKISSNGRAIPGATGFVVSSYEYFHKIIGFSAGLGYSIKLSENLGIEPSIKYLGGKYNEKDSKNDFTRKGLLMNIGIVCYIK